MRQEPLSPSSKMLIPDSPSSTTPSRCPRTSEALRRRKTTAGVRDGEQKKERGAEGRPGVVRAPLAGRAASSLIQRAIKVGRFAPAAAPPQGRARPARVLVAAWHALSD